MNFFFNYVLRLRFLRLMTTRMVKTISYDFFDWPSGCERSHADLADFGGGGGHGGQGFTVEQEIYQEDGTNLLIFSLLQIG